MDAAKLKAMIDAGIKIGPLNMTEGSARSILAIAGALGEILWYSLAMAKTGQLPPPSIFWDQAVPGYLASYVGIRSLASVPSLIRSGKTREALEATTKDVLERATQGKARSDEDPSRI